MEDAVETKEQLIAELEETKLLNELLLDSLPHPAMLIRKDRIILAANRIAREFGAKIGGFCWRDFGQSEFTPEHDKQNINQHNETPSCVAECHFCLADEALENQEPASNPEVKAWNKTWDMYWIPLSKDVYLHYAIDITKPNWIDQELLKAQKLESVSVLTGGIAHDLNNLMTAIMGNISLARMYNDPAEKIRGLEKAESASRMVKELIQQLLTFSSGGAPVKEMATIREILEDSAVLSLRGSNVRCDFSISDDLWAVEIDAVQMNQVISNLVINAAQAMPDGGTIRIMAENAIISPEHALPLNPGTYVNFSVQDHGVGIPDTIRQKIFEPYFTTKREGHGLGLATSYSILRNHGGYIAVESGGVGSTFHIYFPASQEAVPTKGKVVDKGLAIGTGRILVMDNEKHIRDMVAEVLSSIGYEVTTTIDGSGAIDIYKSAMESGDPFDAVIMDLTVPGGMGGKEAIQKLMELDSEVKAIVSSGYSDDPVMSNFRDYGFKDAIAKPYEIGELSEVVHKVLGKSNPQ